MGWGWVEGGAGGGEGEGDTSQPHPRVKPTKPPHGFEGGDRSPLTVGRAHCKGGALNPPPDPKAGRRRWWATDPLPFPSALTLYLSSS